MAHVSEAKKQVVKDFVGLVQEYPIIGAVNMENLPGKQLQNMRNQLREQVVLRMTKRRLLKQVFAQAGKSKPGIEKLSEHLKGMPALIFTKDNPFTLFKTLKKNKSKAPIKAGQTAPNDIIVPAGPTGFAPGPIIGELGGFGIKSGIEDGKVVVKEDSLVAKEGDVISAGLAGVLTRLGIEPMEVGLDLTAVYEEGDIIAKSVLDIDEEEYKNNIVLAVSQARNLSFNTAYPTKDTITLLFSTAAADALALATEKDILTDATAKQVIAKAAGHAASVAGIPDIMSGKAEEPASKPEEKETPAEEKAEEPAEKPAAAEEKPAEAEKTEETEKPAEAENKEN